MGVQIYEGVALVAEMLLHQVLGRGRIAFSQGFQDQPVFLHGFLETIFVVKLAVAIKKDFLSQTVQDIVENLVAGQLLNHHVKVMIGFQIGLMIFVLKVLFEVPVKSLNLFEILLCHLGGRELCAGAFQDAHDFKEIANLADTGLGYIGALVGNQIDQPVGMQNAERFSHGSPAYAHELGEVLFVDFLPPHKTARPDHFTDPGRHFLVKGLRLNFIHQEPSNEMFILYTL